MAKVARFTDKEGDFVGLLINESTDLSISEVVISGDVFVGIRYNDKTTILSLEYGLEEVIELIDECAAN